MGPTLFPGKANTLSQKRRKWLEDCKKDNEGEYSPGNIPGKNWNRVVHNLPRTFYYSTKSLVLTKYCDFLYFHHIFSTNVEISSATRNNKTLHIYDRYICQSLWQCVLNLRLRTLQADKCHGQKPSKHKTKTYKLLRQTSYKNKFIFHTKLYRA